MLSSHKFNTSPVSFWTAPGLLTRYVIKRLYIDFAYRKYPHRKDHAREMARQQQRNKIALLVQKRMKSTIKERKKLIDENYDKISHERNKIVWVYWAQGIESAPEMVKVCVKSVLNKFAGGGGREKRREVVLLSDNNISKYVTLPPHITEKYEKGYISRAMFSDILRIALLIEHGGTWLDATIFCSEKEIPKYMLDSDLFMFQTIYLEKVACFSYIESYVMTACRNNKILMLCRDMIYEWFKSHRGIPDYLFIYILLSIAIEEYPDEWFGVMTYPRICTVELLDELYRPYDPERFNEILNRYPLHKLTYRFPGDDGSGYQYIIDHFPKYGE